jgi:hypothetical protein
VLGGETVSEILTREIEELCLQRNEEYNVLCGRERGHIGEHEEWARNSTPYLIRWGREKEQVMSDILTDADLAEIEKRAEAATQGPWDSPPWVDTLDRWTIHTVRGERDGAVGYLPSFATANSEADRTFIAASRTDIPALLATIRSDRKEIARLRGIEERAKEGYISALPYHDSDTNELLNASPWQSHSVVEMLDGILFGYEAEGDGKVSEPDACHEEDPNADACRAFVMDYEGNAECVRCGAKIGKHPNAERRNDFN